MPKGSRLQNVVTFFREANIDEARVTFQLVKEVMEERLRDKIAKVPVKRNRKKLAEHPGKEQHGEGAPAEAAD